MEGFMILAWGLLIFGVIISKSIRKGGHIDEGYEELKEIIRQKIRGLEDEKDRDTAAAIIISRFLMCRNSHEFKFEQQILKEILMDEIKEDKFKVEIYEGYLNHAKSRQFISSYAAKKELANFEADIKRSHLEKSVK